MMLRKSAPTRTRRTEMLVPFIAIISVVLVLSGCRSGKPATDGPSQGGNVAATEPAETAAANADGGAGTGSGTGTGAAGNADSSTGTESSEGGTTMAASGNAEATQSGSTEATRPGSAGKPQADSPETAVLPDGVKLVGLRYSASGMEMRPDYTIRQVPDGYACSISWGSIYWPEMDGEDEMEYYELNEAEGYGYEPYTSMGDPLGPDGAEHSVVVVGEQEMQTLCDALVAAGVLGMDGYDEVWEAPEGMEVTDTGESFWLKLLFSDGSRVTSHGIDCYPDNYDEVVGVIFDFFEEHQDYSAYYPDEFPESALSTLIMKFYDPYHFRNVQTFQIELHPSWGDEWIVRMADPQGEFLPKGTEVSEYGYVGEGELPMEEFGGILRKYDLGSWNQVTEHEQGGADEFWEVQAYFENGQSYSVSTNRRPNDYDAFREEMIRAIIAYYEKVKK